MQVFKGVVESGGKRAAAFGFPTANIPLSDADTSGIYAAHVRIEAEEVAHPAVAYADQKRALLEAHLLDFPPTAAPASGDLYGKRIEVTLLEKLRDDGVFADEAAARLAIAKDVEAARAYFQMKM